MPSHHNRSSRPLLSSFSQYLLPSRCVYFPLLQFDMIYLIFLICLRLELGKQSPFSKRTRRAKLTHF